MSDNELIKLAIEAKKRSYSPYSKVTVGAALLTKDGKIFTGCNIENASYGASNCAERTALFKAISEGEKDFEVIAIASNLDDYTFPCGICRQVIAEFGPNMRILVVNKDGKYLNTSINELLPSAFTLDR